MRLNFIGFLSTVIVLISLFLPWWSVTYSGLGIGVFQDSREPTDFYGVSKADYSAFYGNARFLAVHGNFTVLFSLSWPLFSTPDQDYWNPTNLTFLLTLTAIFSILAVSLGAVGCFATGSWSNQGRKMFLAMGLVFICAIILQLWFDVHQGIFALLDYHLIPYAYDVGIFGTKQILVENNVGVLSTYPNIGFYLAVSGVISALIAWRYPKWINLTREENRVHINWRRWFEVSERQKQATLFLSSLLMTYVLVFLMIFVF